MVIDRSVRVGSDEMNPARVGAGINFDDPQAIRVEWRVITGKLRHAVHNGPFQTAVTRNGSALDLQASALLAVGESDQPARDRTLLVSTDSFAGNFANGLRIRGLGGNCFLKGELLGSADTLQGIEKMKVHALKPVNSLTVS